MKGRIDPAWREERMLAKTMDKKSVKKIVSNVPKMTPGEKRVWAAVYANAVLIYENQIPEADDLERQAVQRANTAIEHLRLFLEIDETVDPRDYFYALNMDDRCILADAIDRDVYDGHESTKRDIGFLASNR